MNHTDLLIPRKADRATRQLTSEGRDYVQIAVGVALGTALALAAPVVRAWASYGWGL